MTAPRSEGLIVVGVDGSPASRWALRWAASEALLRRTGLIITHVEPLDGKEGAFAHFSHLERLLARSAWAVASSPQAVPLSTHLVRGDMQDVGDELIRMSHRAAMLVLRRARLRPPAVRETLGTIESRLAVGAGCPIVLVSPQEHVETTSGRGVVVSCHASGGDDGTLDLAAPGRRKVWRRHSGPCTATARVLCRSSRTGLATRAPRCWPCPAGRICS